MSDFGSNGLNELDRCRACSHTRLWHDNNTPRHPFDDGTGSTAFLGAKDRLRDERGGDNGNGAPRGAQAAQWPFDPILRQALIDKGILTPEDLRAAEEKIRAVTSSFEATTQGSRHHDPQEDVLRRR